MLSIGDCVAGKGRHLSVLIPPGHLQCSLTAEFDWVDSPSRLSQRCRKRGAERMLRENRGFIGALVFVGAVAVAMMPADGQEPIDPRSASSGESAPCGESAPQCDGQCPTGGICMANSIGVCECHSTCCQCMNGCSGDMTFCSAASDAVALEEICKITGCGEAGCAVPATCGSGGFVDCGPLGACCLGDGRCNLLNANRLRRTRWRVPGGRYELRSN